MAQDGLQLQELFTSVALCKEDQVALLSAVRKAEPTFSPPQPPLLSSQVNTSPLLRDIYDKVSPSPLPGTCRWGLLAWGLSQGCPVPVGSPGISAFPLFLLTECQRPRDPVPAPWRLRGQGWQVPGPQQGLDLKAEAARSLREE